MRRMIVLFLLICHGSAVIAASGPPPDDLAAKLSKQVSNYDLGMFDLVGALIRASADFQIPMGIIWVNAPATHAQLPFAWKHATVGDIIRDIAKTQPGYQVQISNGLVHVFPPIPDRENFLKIHIGQFGVQDQYVELAYYKLHTILTPIKGNHQISIAGPGDSKVTVELSNSTVEDALDALAAASNRKIWVVTFSDDTHLTSRGLRRSVSLWSNTPSDTEEPGWDLLRWGDPMPPLVATTKQ